MARKFSRSDAKVAFEQLAVLSCRLAAMERHISKFAEKCR